jgi:uroporphyrinogen decarboxylase
MSQTTSEHRLIRAARRQPVDRPPVWIMRQAGRYMPEFRAIRSKVDFLTLCKTPDLAIEVSMQPVEHIGVDAAIIFSDILIPVEPMGMAVRFDDKGPHLDNPLRSVADIERLRVPVASETVPFLGEAISGLKRELAGRLPVIGFCGAPWTLAAYMVEGGGSKNYSHIKGLMYTDPAAFHRLMDKLADTLIDYLRLQIAAGADIVQIFESWGGYLSPRDYREFALPATKRIIAGVKDLGKPVILYMNGAGHVLADLADSGADVVGIDWRIELADAFAAVGDRVALQGNMDPCRLYGSPESIRAEVRRLASSVAGRPGHIFNLGHGILPDVPVAHAQAFVRAVQELADVVPV